MLEQSRIRGVPATGEIPNAEADDYLYVGIIAVRWESDRRRSIIHCMKTPRAVLMLIFASGTIFAPSYAQLVKLSFSLEPDPVILFRANHATTPWDHTVGFVTELDLQYDTQGMTGMLDPEKNFWHARIESRELGDFELVRPIQSIYVMGNYVEFWYLNRSGPFELFDLSLVFHNEVLLRGDIPLPPFPAIDNEGLLKSGFSIDGGRSYFDVPDLGEAYGGGRIESVTVGMTPIPEASTYSLGLLAGLSFVILHRIRTRGNRFYFV